MVFGAMISAERANFVTVLPPFSDDDVVWPDGPASSSKEQHGKSQSLPVDGRDSPCMEFDLVLFSCFARLVLDQELICGWILFVLEAS